MQTSYVTSVRIQKTERNMYIYIFIRSNLPLVLDMVTMLQWFNTVPWKGLFMDVRLKQLLKHITAQVAYAVLFPHPERGPREIAQEIMPSKSAVSDIKGAVNLLFSA